MITTIMNKKRGLMDTISCLAVESPGCNITENLEQNNNTTLTPVGQATDKKLQTQTIK